MCPFLQPAGVLIFRSGIALFVVARTMNATITCDECGSIVELLKRENRTLSLMCDCPEERSIKVARGLPEAWE